MLEIFKILVSVPQLHGKHINEIGISIFYY
jgi:hypothetical protein